MKFTVMLKNPITKKVLDTYTIDIPSFDMYAVRTVYGMSGADSIDILREREHTVPPRLLEMAEENLTGVWYGN